MIWILVGYMWLFLHRPFEIWPIFATIRLERVYMIFTLLAWLGFSAKTWTSNKNNVALFLIAFSIFIATLFSPYSTFGDNLATENWFKMFVFFLLMMTSVKSEKELKILTTAFSVCFTLYMLHSLREYFNGKGVYRMGTWRMVGVDSTMSDPNSFGNSINYALAMLLPVAALMKQELNKKMKRFYKGLFYSSFVLSVWCIQLTGSRSSFAVLGGSLLGLAMLSKYRFRLLLGLAIAAPLIWFALPEDLHNRYMTLIDPSYGPANAADSAQRSKGFFVGLQVWKDNILFGVGPGCFPIAPHEELVGMQTHNLYGQVLSELGTLGAIAYLSLVGMVCLNHWTAHSFYRRMESQHREKEALYLYRVSFAVAWSVFLLLVLGGGAHNAFRYTWVWYAAFQAMAVELLRKKANAQVRLLARRPHRVA